MDTDGSYRSQLIAIDKIKMTINILNNLHRNRFDRSSAVDAGGSIYTNMIKHLQGSIDHIDLVRNSMDDRISDSVMIIDDPNEIN